ncbi:MAG TPA: rod-binding protein [Amaricoccus sp.]|jgi:Rod binding domain-containing protein|nr:rod-binding protein [Amaricoccus sp.]
MEIPPITLVRPRAAGSVEPGAPAMAAARSDADIRAAAESFEASFLTEMLQYTGLNTMPAGFGGGAGEQAFSSLLTEQYARLLSERGGVGLAERIFDILKQRTTSDT